MGFTEVTRIPLLLFVVVGLSSAWWVGHQQGQAPLGAQLQQSPGLSPWQSFQVAQASASFLPPRPALSSPVVYPSKFQDPASFQSKQIMAAPMPPLAWHFPVVTEEPPLPVAPFQLHVPTPSQSVAVHCDEDFVHVEALKDFFGTGQLVNSSFLTLGGCASVGESTDGKVVIFQYPLQECGSSLTMTDNELVYTFTLSYMPEALEGTPIVRTDAAAVGIQCHYPRLQNVSSNVLMPSWVTFAATKTAEEALVFSLKLMTDDWMYERPSNQYFLGQFLNFEASVKEYNHAPLRIFIDVCVATAAPETNSTPSYVFIQNQGCLVDAKLTGSGSSFMHRVQNDSLHFQLETFRFQQTNGGLVYITCGLRAVLASDPISQENKACSFGTSGWLSADDNDQMCACCDSTCILSRKGRGLPDSGLIAEGTATIGPVVVNN